MPANVAVAAATAQGFSQDGHVGEDSRPSNDSAWGLVPWRRPKRQITIDLHAPLIHRRVRNQLAD
jgi:hypothetical protein